MATCHTLFRHVHICYVYVSGIYDLLVSLRAVATLWVYARGGTCSDLRQIGRGGDKTTPLVFPNSIRFSQPSCPQKVQRTCMLDLTKSGSTCLDGHASACCWRLHIIGTSSIRCCVLIVVIILYTYVIIKLNPFTSAIRNRIRCHVSSSVEFTAAYCTLQ